MSDPIRLEACSHCGVAVPPDAPRCPECGAVRARGARPERARPEDLHTERAGGGDRIEDPFEVFGPMFGGPTTSRRSLWGPLARSFLGRNLGCLVPLLVVVFGLPLLVGALMGDALGTLAVVLLIVGCAGLALTGWLVWLVMPRQRKPR